MGERDTGYIVLRFVAGFLTVLGALFLVIGAAGLILANLAAFHLIRPLLDVLSSIFGSVALVWCGIFTIGLGQGIKSLADIADNSQFLPLILERLARPRYPAAAPEPSSPPGLGTLPSSERPCPTCGMPVSPPRPVCPRCGTRVRFSRPA